MSRACECCNGDGVIDMRRFAYADSNPAEPCPDCGGTGRGPKRHVYRPGDKVRILRPLFVRRVGYPLVWYEIEDEQLYADPRIVQALRAFGLARRVPFGGTVAVCDEIPRHLQIAFAKEYVAQNRFGGNARTIHYHAPGTGYDMPLNWTCGPAEVVRKRVAKTGTRFPGRIYRSGSDYDEDYEPGGLENCRTHILLDLGCGYEIEACNVEPWTK